MTPDQWLERLSRIEKEFFSVPGGEDPGRLEQKYLGRKGELALLLRELSSFSIEDKKRLGQTGNALKNKLQENLDSRKTSRGAAASEARPALDLALSGYPYPRGSVHPVTFTANKIIDSLGKLGFSLEDGPLAEMDYYNFEALNFPPHHPARDMQDTFYLNLKDEKNMDYLLRTHTSPVQIRTMKSRKPPVRAISFGKTFRSEAVDASHSFVFHQMEGFYADKNVSMADLKWTLETFIKDLFGSGAKIRFSPSYFPFVEPGAQVEVSCVFCGRNGAAGAGQKPGGEEGKCPVCKGSGWLEMLGAGMIHSEVFKACGYDPEKVSGFAFGAGIERFAMLLFGIRDMRMLYENDLRILKQL
ncbi:MAG: phenylalanine--tRNA ligase subunit alpha [Elusimicrobia bacterium CG08_land_8_20_14_0_20_51_18]|nr:MAG: phenylalanine--tRNA ligase subunit alpha [Elusimicrobia bacterium CG08_land_8_20_14_0_20_51_18]